MNKKSNSSFLLVLAFVGLVIYLWKKFPGYAEKVVEFVEEEGGDLVENLKAEVEKGPVPTKPKKQESRLGELNPRQQRIYKVVAGEKEVSMRQISAKVKSVSTRTLRRDMDRLEELGVIEQVGKTRDRVYRSRVS